MKKITFVALVWMLANMAFAQSRFANITCRFYSLKTNDTVVLTIDKYGFPSIPGLHTTYKAKLKNYIARFHIPVGPSPLRFYLTVPGGDRKVTFLHAYLSLDLADNYVEEDDNLVITVRDSSVTFDGKGAEKFKIKEQLDMIGAKTKPDVSFASPKGWHRYAMMTDTDLVEKINYLNACKKSISYRMYQMLKGDIYGEYFGKFSQMGYAAKKPTLIKSIADSLEDYHCKLPNGIIDKKMLNRLQGISYSSAYSWGLINQYKYDSCYRINHPFNLKKAYVYFTGHFNGPLKERVTFELLFSNKRFNDDFVLLAKDALTFTKTADICKMLNSLINNHDVGRQAYNFELPDTSGQNHRLADFKGKVVLLDYYYNGCGGCRRMAPYIARVEKRFINKPVQFISISIDRTKSIWLSGIKSGAYTSGDVLNLYTAGMVKSHPALEHFNVTGFPTLILIDKNGKLMRNPVDPRDDDGKDLVGAIEKEIQ